MPGRRYPGVVIQGDSLSILFDLAMGLTELLPEASDAELREVAAELAEKLFDHVRNYEAVLKEHGVALPYSRDPYRVPRSQAGSN
jgi:type VI protein secretion system component VasF